MSRQTISITLVGGDEFTGRTEPLDRLLLGESARPAAVAIVPAAAARERPELAAANGVAHFSRLGAEAYAVMIVDNDTANDTALIEGLRRADVVYLTGGSPAHLVESLRGSRAWSLLRELHSEGTLLAGSSAGAMALCGSMSLRGSRLDGLGLLPGVVVAPHFERAGDDRVAALQAATSEGTAVLGIDGATGCLLGAGEWTVAGAGRVHVITRRAVSILSAGDTFRLDP